MDCYSKILYPALDDDHVSAVICVILCVMMHSGLLPNSGSHPSADYNTPS